MSTVPKWKLTTRAQQSVLPIIQDGSLLGGGYSKTKSSQKIHPLPFLGRMCSNKGEKRILFWGKKRDQLRFLTAVKCVRLDSDPVGGRSGRTGWSCPPAPRRRAQGPRSQRSPEPGSEFAEETTMTPPIIDRVFEPPQGRKKVPIPEPFLFLSVKTVFCQTCKYHGNQITKAPYIEAQKLVLIAEPLVRLFGGG